MKIDWETMEIVRSLIKYILAKEQSYPTVRGATKKGLEGAQAPPSLKRCAL